MGQRLPINDKDITCLAEMSRLKDMMYECNDSFTDLTTHYNDNGIV